MGRAAHNFKRRQKLIFKHTGREYAPRGKGGKTGQGKGADQAQQKSWWDASSWWDGSWESQADERSPKKNKLKKKSPISVGEKTAKKMTKKPQTEIVNNDTEPRQKKGSKKKTMKLKVTVNDGESKVKKILRKRKLKKAGTMNVIDGSSVNDGESKVKKILRKRKLKKAGTMNVTDGSSVNDGESKVKKILRKRKLKEAGTMNVVDGKPKKVRKKTISAKTSPDTAIPEEAVEPKEKFLSKKALRRERLRERMKQRHRAYIICPGSVSERFTRGPLNGNERRLLATGSLSWRWLRDAKADEEVVSPNPSSTSLKPGRILHDADALRPNHQAHNNELWTRQQSLPSKAAEALKYLDGCLESDAMWPPCVARVALASRLQARGGIRKRCLAYLNEVVEPLLADAPTVASSENEQSKSEALMAEARSLCLRCAQKWSSQEFDMHALKSIWLRMLTKALAHPRSEDGETKEVQSNWFRALRAAILSRLCPRKDDDGQQFLLKSIATAAADAGKGKNDSSLMMIPLGVFTFWQALFLVLVTQSLGTAATVVRRRADGTPQVIFRCAET